MEFSCEASEWVTVQALNEKGLLVLYKMFLCIENSTYFHDVFKGVQYFQIKELSK